MRRRTAAASQEHSAREVIPGGTGPNDLGGTRKRHWTATSLPFWTSANAELDGRIDDAIMPPRTTLIAVAVTCAGFFAILFFAFNRELVTATVTTTTKRTTVAEHTPKILPTESTLYAIGLVRDINDVRPNILQWLAEVNCYHDVGIHIVTGRRNIPTTDISSRLDHYRNRIIDEHSREPRVERTNDRNNRHNESNDQQRAKGKQERSKQFPGCAPATIVEEDEGEIFGGDGGDSPVPTNRVERIAALRDYQRELLRSYYMTEDYKSSGEVRNGAVIVIDLDLAMLPPPDSAVLVAKRLASSIVHRSNVSDSFVDHKKKDKSARRGIDDSYPFDVICAAGVTTANKNELWYYDTYATVLWPDTFVHPLSRRLIKSYFPGEDKSLVRSNDRNGKWTQGDIMRYFQQLAEISSNGAVKVKSCFGGMAIYRASVFFKNSCQYGLDPTGLERYSSEADLRPCEHVVFHDCLVSERSHSRIAIMPALKTLWKKDQKK